MTKAFLKLFLLAITATGFVSCKKEGLGLLSTPRPDVPVTVSNLYGTFNGVPAVATSVSGGGAISITLNIPPGTGRTIREITRVGISNVPSNYRVVQTTTGLYKPAPIAGNGTSVTFNTTLAEYTSITGLAVTASGTATSFLGRYFYFLLTLDNGETVIPVPVRVYVNP